MGSGAGSRGGPEHGVGGPVVTKVDACAQFSTPNPFTDSGRTDATEVAGQTAGLPYPSYHVDIVYSARAGSLHYVGPGAQDWMLVGHNLLTVDLSYDYFNKPISDAVRQNLDQIRLAALTSMVADLRR